MYKSKYSKKANGKKLNIGLQILRTICAFLVIVCHFYGHSKYRIIVIQNKYYIITFFYMSFYFSYNTLASRNISKIKGRFKRMLVPYIIWPLLFYLKDKFNHFIINKIQYLISNIYIINLLLDVKYMVYFGFFLI